MAGYAEQAPESRAGNQHQVRRQQLRFRAEDPLNKEIYGSPVKASEQHGVAAEDPANPGNAGAHDDLIIFEINGLGHHEGIIGLADRIKIVTPETILDGLNPADGTDFWGICL